MAIAADRISTKLFIQHPTAFDIKIVGILEQLAPGQSTHGRKIALVRAASTFNLNKRAYLSNISIFRFYMERWGQLYSQYLRQRDDVLSGHKLNQKVHFQAQRLSIPKTTCRSIAFRLVPVRFSVSLAVLFFFFFLSQLHLNHDADLLPFHLSGNHETGGIWKQGALDEDLVDLQAVVDYLKQTYGYVIELLVGHSRGSIIAFRWISTTEDGRKVSAFVNASGRYRMAVRVQYPFIHLVS